MFKQLYLYHIAHDIKVPICLLSKIIDDLILAKLFIIDFLLTIDFLLATDKTNPFAGRKLAFGVFHFVKYLALGKQRGDWESWHTLKRKCRCDEMVQPLRKIMTTSSNGSIFRVTGPLCGEFTGPR